MLVVRAVSGEKIRIGSDVYLTVCDVGSDFSVKIGVEAPKSVRVLRKELFDLLKEENVTASWHGDMQDMMEIFNGEK